MLKLVIGNRAYSSWSLRGWLACKLSGLEFETLVVPLYDHEWPERRQGRDFAPSAGKVPILWDGDTVVWDSIAILEWLSDKVGNERFWPADDRARAFARSISAEMHSGYVPLRQACSMNLRHRMPTPNLPEEAKGDIDRIASLWTQALEEFGTAGDGPFLFGEFNAADAMFAPVVTRFATYSIPLPERIATYCNAVLTHPWMKEWITAAQEEPWIIEKFEPQSA